MQTREHLNVSFTPQGSVEFRTLLLDARELLGESWWPMYLCHYVAVYSDRQLKNPQCRASWRRRVASRRRPRLAYFLPRHIEL
jgi:hypothetical protein